MDLMLINMPMAAPERPSIGLGELKATLAGSGIEAEVCYANLLYLDWIGVAAFKLYDRTRAEDGLVDWLFGAAAFPEAELEPERYLERFMERNAWFTRQAPKDIVQRLLEQRARTPAFVEWVADRILAREPRLVGCSSTFQQHVASLAVLRRIKERAPETITLLGGANCETRMGAATHRNFPWVDVVVSGEADGFFPELCRSLLEEGREVAPGRLPEGVFAPAHRTLGYPTVARGDGLPRATTEDMSRVPLPDYDDYFRALGDTLFVDWIRPGLPIETARGCWWGMKNHCTFCGLNGGGMTFRSKPAAQALAELDQLHARHGIDRFEAVDNILAADYFERFLPELAASGARYKLFYETKANLKPEEIEALVAAGVTWIQPGIESLHSRVLKLMRKGVAGWNNIRLLRLSSQHGLRVSWSILTSFPGEDDAWYVEMAEWLPALAHLQPGGMNALRFDRYSPYFNEAEAFGLTLRPAELYRFVYPLAEPELNELVYYFEADDRAEENRSQLRGALSERPGLAAVQQAARAWIDAWKQEVPRLELRREAGGLEILDTRPAAAERSCRLAGAAAAALELALDDPARHRFEEAMAAAGHGAEATRAALAELKARRLVLELDGRIVGLPLVVPYPALPNAREFPGGSLLQQAERQRPARQAAQPVAAA